MVQENSDGGTLCKTPTEYEDGKQLAGLMTLKCFVEGGYEVMDGRILVCVKSIGGKKKSKKIEDHNQSSNVLAFNRWRHILAVS